MYNKINALPDTSRVWVYQSNRAFTSSEVSQINNELELFISTWNAHGSELDASFTIEKNQFIIISVDESVHAASGCSIDKSVGVVRNIESTYNLNLFDRTNIAFLSDSDGEVKTFKLSETKAKVSDGVLLPSTKIFDNTIQTLGDFRNKWLIEAENSWLKRYFKVNAK